MANQDDAIGELEQDIIDYFNERFEKISLPIDLSFLFQKNNKKKQLITLTKIPENYAYALKKQIIVEINDVYYDNFNAEDENITKILFDQEIDRIEANLEKGTFKLVQPNFKASKGIIEKYGFEEVDRAMEVESLFEKQQKDKNESED